MALSIGEAVKAARRLQLRCCNGQILVVGTPIPLAILGSLGVGVLCGVINGGLVAYVTLQPFVVTLGTLSTYRA